MSNNYPISVVRILRQRLDETDRDEQYNEMPPREVMEHLVAWRLGSPDWFGWFESQLDAVGLKIVPKVD